MAKFVSIEPPVFVSDVKSYAQYKSDLLMWSRISGIDKKVQAETVVYRLEGHPSGIKDKIMTQISDKIQNKEDGIEQLIAFLDEIYLKDDMADTWDRFIEFSSFSRKPNQDIPEFIADWTNCYHKLKASGCEYPDMIKGLKLLKDAELNDIETKLVLTGVNYETAKEKKDLEKQIVASLKKFKGRAAISKEGSDVSVKVEPTWAAHMEDVFVAKGWKPPKKNSRRRSRSESPKRSKNSNYKGRKNPLGENHKPLKCYICRCNHIENCSCPCVYHLANKCPARGKSVILKESSIQGDTKQPDIGLFMGTNNLFSSKKADTEEEDMVFVVKQSLDNLVLLSSENLEAVIDCACPTTIAGQAWMESFHKELDLESRKKICMEESKRIFKFGGGEKRKSRALITFPCHLAGKNITMKTEVVHADFPLLLGNSMLKKAGAVLNLKEGKAIIMGKEVLMKETQSGHFTLKISAPQKDEEFASECLLNWKETHLDHASEKQNVKNDEEFIVCLINTKDSLSRKDVFKLHHVFGHVSIKRIEELICKAGKMSDQVKEYLEEIKVSCKSCKLDRNSKPLPRVAIPRATKFNQIVTIDLKTYEYRHFKYILYLIDMFSRLTAGVFIVDKNPSSVGAKIMDKWISNFGRMEKIHSDRGGEFCCSELTDIAEYLGIRSTFTASYSPNQNGTNERNHAICDRMMSKMLNQDPEIPADVALTWAITAKNTLQNVSGFSPFQIVFGQNPSLPSVYTAGPPGLEEVEMSKAVADHINALFLAREAYIEGESDKVLKAALKQRIYKRGEEICPGNWIYFKNKGAWSGPVKVVGKDGKSLYAVRGGKLLTINSDHSQLAMFEGDFNDRLTDSSDSKNSSNVAGDQSGEKECIVVQDNNSFSTDQLNPNNVNSNPQEIVGPIKKNVKIRFQRKDSSDWVQGVVLSRAGKKGGKYDKWWNIKNTSTGHVQPEDINGFTAIEKVIDDSKVVVEEEVYVAQVPRYRYNEDKCKKAKDEELKSWDEYQVYMEVDDEGQTRLGTNWVLTEKVCNAVTKIKARLTVRGDQEESTGIRKDSPTVRKSNIKVFTTLAAKEHWDIKASDVACAFLQGTEIDRDVFVLPPKERRVPGVLWKLLKSVYGLVDAPRGWHLALDGKLLDAGCEKCHLDPAMYFSFQNSDSGRLLQGIALSHVDDLLHGGSAVFEEEIMAKVKSSFKFGHDESNNFRYVGMNMSQTKQGITIDQDHYVKSLELPDMEVAKGQKMNDTLNEDGQVLFRGCVGKILHVGYLSRPDVSFEAKCLSTKYGKATKGDLKSAFKKIQKLQEVKTLMFFPDVGGIEGWQIVGYGDAGIRSMPDKVSSVGGQVILLANEKKGVACVLSWKAKKLVRKVVSSLAGEALALVATIGEIVYIRAIFEQIYGDGVNDIPLIIYTDSKNLYESIHSSSLVEDSWLIPDIAIIKEALEKGTVSNIRRVSSEDMLANCLTKKGASAEALLQVLQSGIYILPPGLD